MKNLTTTSGVIGAIVIAVGAIFKSLHYPGSAVLVTMGAACLIIYALLYMLEKVKTVGDGTGKAYTVLFGITGMIMSLAFLFKNIDYYGNPPSRALFDVCAVAVAKNARWANSTSIPHSIRK